jgi:nitrous oxidase accessory protein NosD
LGGKKVVLDSDLSCTTYPSLTVVGPGTFDMDGHTLIGGVSGGIGLRVEGQRGKVRNGVVDCDGDGCYECVSVAGAGGHTLEGVVVRGCEDWGFHVVSSRNTLKSCSAVSTGSGVGYRLNGERSTVRDSQAVDNAAGGFWIYGIGHTVSDSIAIGNGNQAFYVSGSGHKIRGNTVIDSSYGIFVTGTDTMIQNNRSLSNSGYDLSDLSANCDDNNWSNNIFGTSNQACIE